MMLERFRQAVERSIQSNAVMAGAILAFGVSGLVQSAPAPKVLLPIAALLTLAGLARVRARPPEQATRPKGVEAVGCVVRHTGTARGRGVFAVRPFRCGELIEASPATLFAAGQQLPTEIYDLCFSFGNNAEGTRVWGVAHGLGSMFNHDSPANAQFDPLIESMEVRFVALRDISAGEEITVNYSNGATGTDEGAGFDWFAAHGVTRVETSNPPQSSELQ